MEHVWSNYWLQNKGTFITSGICTICIVKMVWIKCSLTLERHQSPESSVFWHTWTQELENWGLRIENWGLRIENWELRIDDWGLRNTHTDTHTHTLTHTHRHTPSGSFWSHFEARTSMTKNINFFIYWHDIYHWKAHNLCFKNL